MRHCKLNICGLEKNIAIILTGDVHQAIGIGEQAFINCSEAALSVEYAQIAARYGLKVTLFFTGRAVVEDGPDARTLLTMKNVEIGGHGWDALRPRLWHRALSGLTGSPHGPAWLQRRMIRRTCATIEQYTGRPVRSWRNHAYRHNKDTPYLLAEAGIAVWSDKVELVSVNPRRHSSGILVLPINTLPDHENMYHAERTPEYVAAEGRGPSYPPAVWCDKVCAQVERVVNDGGMATILAHPICMKIADDFTTFEQLCAFLSRYPSLFASEAAERWYTHQETRASLHLSQPRPGFRLSSPE